MARVKLQGLANGKDNVPIQMNVHVFYQPLPHHGFWCTTKLHNILKEVFGISQADLNDNIPVDIILGVDFISKHLVIPFQKSISILPNLCLTETKLGHIISGYNMKPLYDGTCVDFVNFVSYENVLRKLKPNRCANICFALIILIDAILYYWYFM